MFNIEMYLSTLEDKNYYEIINSIDNEVSSIESKMYWVRWWPKLRELWWPEYSSKLKWFLFFLRYWKKPNWVSILPLKKICTILVEKWELKKEILDNFN